MAGAPPAPGARSGRAGPTPAQWAALAVLVAAGLVWMAWFAAQLPPIPTRLPDGRLVLSQRDFEAPEAAALRPYAHMDHWSYLAMAEHPFSHHEQVRFAPLGWRILTPLAVHLLPLRREAGFYLLASLGLALTAVFLYLFLRDLLASHEWALWGAATFFLLDAASAVHLHRHVYLEATTLPFVTGGLLALQRGRQGWLLACLGVGVLQRETVLLLGPTALVALWARGQRTPGTLLRAAAFLGLPLAILALVRLALPSPQGYTTLRSIAFFWHDFYQPHLARGPWHAVPFFYLYLVQVWGIPGLLATTAGLGASFRFLRRHGWLAVFLALVYAGLIMGPNPDRYLCYAAPVVIALYLTSVRELIAGVRVQRAVVGALSALQGLWSLNDAVPYLDAGGLRVRHLLLAAAAVVAAAILTSVAGRARRLPAP